MIEAIVDWTEKARKHYRQDKVGRLIPEYLWYREGISWGATSRRPSFRFLPSSATFDVKGSSIFIKEKKYLVPILGFLNSKISTALLEMLNPTISIQVKDVRDLPILSKVLECIWIKDKIDEAVRLSNEDWSTYETSNSFLIFFLLSIKNDNSLANVFSQWENHAHTRRLELKRLEEENNRYWIDAYGLQDELTPEVPDDQITIRRADLERDIKSFISYAVGCMMGRYSLQRPGLILASQGQTVEDYWRIVNSSQLTVTSEQQETPLTTGKWQLTTDPPTDDSQLTTAPPLATENWQLKTPPLFQPEPDAMIPIPDQAYFDDDIVSRFVEFVKVAFGPETLTENLDFIANALKLKSGETALDRIRRYFVNEFISDHIKTYKKRPIYWLFTSGKKRAFGALVYLHRYAPDTVGRIRTDYILELQVKLDKEIERLQAQADAATTTAAKRAATKRLKELQDQQLELRDYQAKVQTFGDQRIALDLDDGVAYNYTRFKGIVYEGTDLKMKDLEKKAQWKLDLLKQQEATP